MKTLILCAAVAASLSLTACEDKPPVVVHDTTVVHEHVHHTHTSGENVNAPSSNGPDNFEAVERPATYSH